MCPRKYVPGKVNKNRESSELHAAQEFLCFLHDIWQRSSVLKEQMGAQLIDMLLQEATTHVPAKQGADYVATEGANCFEAGLKVTGAGLQMMSSVGGLQFAGYLLLALVTKCPKNQRAVAAHEKFEPLIRDVLPGAVALELQLQLMEIVYVLKFIEPCRGVPRRLFRAAPDANKIPFIL
jgi:hypothetical protein